MRREEKRRKFLEAVLSTLYPPPLSPPPQEEDKDKNPVSTSDDDFDVGLINPDDHVRGSTSSRDDDGDNGEGSDSRHQKLTRAQRKRLRNKKLNEDAARRRKIIGPLLPPTSDEGNNGRGGGGGNDSPDVRQNADEECAAVSRDKSGELPGCSNQKKLKQRRMAKRLARERLRISTMENRSFESSHDTGKIEFSQD